METTGRTGRILSQRRVEASLAARRRRAGIHQLVCLINYTGDGNWWLGTFTDNQLTFALAGTTDPGVVGLLG